MARGGKKSGTTVDPLELMRAAVAGKHGEGSVVRLQGAGMFLRSDIREVIPSGLQPLDHHVLGCGGWPVGKVVEVMGDFGSGKTSLALRALANCQREGGFGICIDAEHTLDRHRLSVFGIDPEQILFFQPVHLEQMFQQVGDALAVLDPSKHGPVLVVWDSVPALPTEAEHKSELEQSKAPAERARILGKLLPFLIHLLPRKRAVLLGINQMREKVGVMFGSKRTSPGGHAFRHLAHVRLEMWSGGVVKRAGDPDPVGKSIYIKSTKTRTCPPGRQLECRFLYTTGFDNRWTTMNFAKDRGLIPKSAALPGAYAAALEALRWPEQPEDAPDAAFEEQEELLEDT